MELWGDLLGLFFVGFGCFSPLCSIYMDHHHICPILIDRKPEVEHDLGDE